MLSISRHRAFLLDISQRPIIYRQLSSGRVLPITPCLIGYHLTHWNPPRRPESACHTRMIHIQCPHTDPGNPNPRIWSCLCNVSRVISTRYDTSFQVSAIYYLKVLIFNAHVITRFHFWKLLTTKKPFILKVWAHSLGSLRVLASDGHATYF